MLTLASTVFIVTITVRAADQSESYLSWAVFAALIIGGAVTALQAGSVRGGWEPGTCSRRAPGPLS